ncbi:hypothetical protein IX334_001929 [Bacteroides pyogenes]|nr:hypothetical protein [Bacteroides pyogenes]MBR8737697.1 hypothetical protein [Bacteroides pyogenes]MBR8753257.1 hypothetical protein [Bacteroides pyogenes]MBR8794679.1 hypothetical protein [Bacteroides pyogenes]
MSIAKKQTIKRIATKYHCRDCANSYDWHSKALDGSLILCRCKYDAKTEHGKWCKFLKDPQCEHFKLKA